jgi:hypothetical protein
VKVARLISLVAVLVVGCSTTTPSPNPWPPVLNVENRGGHAFEVRIGGTAVATVACDSGAAIAPGKDGVPVLPWDLTVIRLADRSVVLSTHVAALPRWFVSFGDNVGGPLDTAPVAGPPGPSCPPSG